MNYLDFIEKELKLPEKDKNSPLVLDLFAGCGGLALGFEAAGFRTIGYEMLPVACQTYNKNLKGWCKQVFLDTKSELDESADVVIGGPPCQPFSVIGNQSGVSDPRNGFPAFLSAVEKYNPKIVVFENVRGMFYRNKWYLDKIVEYLQDNLKYNVEPPKILNAVHYGVPQRRERLFVVAHRGNWKFPEPFHWNFTAGDALGELAFSIPESAKFLTKSMDDYIERYERKSHCMRPRDLHLDQPSRTVTCRNLNGATGDMLRIRLPDGRRRRLTVREAAKLQSFPDWFEFCGSEGEQFNQIGNAVPPLLAKAVAMSVLQCIKGTDILENTPSLAKKHRMMITQ
ncbi:MAG: DNA cytosine methyltransferase [Candidatus Aenigmarchaeota archaeon]|nr:DNA cytosine methyltransferase [Candidatus Aenigmarchaeota archaeon]